MKVQLAYQAAKAGGRLFAARAAVEAWSRVVDPETPELLAAWSELSRDLRRAETLAARARNLERTDPPMARTLYRQSLAIAADLPEAVAGLGHPPPDALVVLDTRVLGDRIQLWWTPPPPDGLGTHTYVNLSKRGRSIQNPADGTRIAEVSTCEFDDTHAAPGDTVGYAVLSKRGGTESISAISLGPFVFLADVKDVRVDFRPDVVELAWQPPRGVSEIRVIRKRGAPPNDPRDGDRIATAIDHTLDRNVDPNEVYHYGIYAIYKMSDGRLFPSPGIVVSATQATVNAGLPAVARTRARCRLDWIEPVRGAVRSCTLADPLPVPAGTRLPAAKAAARGRRIEPASPGRAYDPEPPTEGHCYYTPLTVWNALYTVGHGVALSRVPDPSELRATRAGGGIGGGSSGIRVTLRWQWAAEANATLVVARVQLHGGQTTSTQSPRPFRSPTTTAWGAGRSAYP